MTQSVLTDGRRLRRRAAPACEPDFLPSLPAVLRRVYAQRGLRDAAELEYATSGLLPSEQLAGLPAAVRLLAAARQTERAVLVVGDFDADGATSTAVALRGLRALGLQKMDYLVPDRFRFGYGLSPDIVALAAAQGAELIVTVDNGISSIAGVEAARDHGMQVLVTDHHLPGPELPPADALVNPNLPNDAFASKHLAGVGVIFYVLLGLRRYLHEQGALAKPVNLAGLLDLVALGTVADVVSLDHNNRILVEQGLRRIRAGEANPGILALLQIAGRDRRKAHADDLGFAVGPRLNAAGRLDDMSLGIECLLAQNADQAYAAAQQLDELNRARRELQNRMQAEAIATVSEASSDQAGICLFDADWHQGIVGLVASRVRERLHRPVVAFAPGVDAELKGSARSIPGVHIRDLIERIATAQPGLITRFGGHAMAAGLALPQAHFSAFATAFDQLVATTVPAHILRGEIESDGELDPSEMSLQVALDLRAGGPWGQGFPPPRFDGHFYLLKRNTVGNGHLKLRLRPAAANHELDAIAFNADLERWPQPNGTPVHLLFRLDVNDFRGRSDVQLVVEHLLNIE